MSISLLDTLLKVLEQQFSDLNSDAESFVDWLSESIFPPASQALQSNSKLQALFKQFAKQSYLIDKFAEYGLSNIRYDSSQRYIGLINLLAKTKQRELSNIIKQLLSVNSVSPYRLKFLKLLLQNSQSQDINAIFELLNEYGIFVDTVRGTVKTDSNNQRNVQLTTLRSNYNILTLVQQVLPTLSESLTQQSYPDGAYRLPYVILRNRRIDIDYIINLTPIISDLLVSYIAYGFDYLNNCPKGSRILADCLYRVAEFDDVRASTPNIIKFVYLTLALLKLLSSLAVSYITDWWLSTPLAVISFDLNLFANVFGLLYFRSTYGDAQIQALIQILSPIQQSVDQNSIYIPDYVVQQCEQNLLADTTLTESNKLIVQQFLSSLRAIPSNDRLVSKLWFLMFGFRYSSQSYENLYYQLPNDILNDYLNFASLSFPYDIVFKTVAEQNSLTYDSENLNQWVVMSVLGSRNLSTINDWLANLAEAYPESVSIQMLSRLYQFYLLNSDGLLTSPKIADNFTVLVYLTLLQLLAEFANIDDPRFREHFTQIQNLLLNRNILPVYLLNVELDATLPKLIVSLLPSEMNLIPVYVRKAIQQSITDSFDSTVSDIMTLLTAYQYQTAQPITTDNFIDNSYLSDSTLRAIPYGLQPSEPITDNLKLELDSIVHDTGISSILMRLIDVVLADSNNQIPRFVDSNNIKAITYTIVSTEQLNNLTDNNDIQAIEYTT